MLAENVLEKIRQGSTWISGEIERDICHQFERGDVTSPIEQIFLAEWTFTQHLQPIRIKLRPQRRVGSYYVDFVPDLYEHFISTSTNANRGKNLDRLEAELPKFAIELDGHWHEKDKRQVEYDKRRERYLQKQGYQVIRFAGTEVVRDPSACVGEALEVVMPAVYALRSKYGNKGGW